MPAVSADPDKLRQFAKALTSVAQQVEQLARGLQRSLDATGWQDSERQRFEADFKQALKGLTQVATTLQSRFAPDVQKKADALDRFHS